MDLSVVIVNWNTRDLLDKCLASIWRETKGIEFEVIVIDNASADDSVKMTATRHPQVELIASNRNLGFAAANNLGLERCRGEFVLLLNPDTEIIEDSFSRLVEFMRRVPSASIAGPRLLNADRLLQPSVRRFPDLLTQVLMTLKIQGVFPGLPSFRRRQAADFDYDKEQACDQVMGAAFMINRRAFEVIGKLDAGYWIWFEEVDYCKMAAEHGLQTWYTPTTSIIHHGGEAFGQVFGPKKQGYFDRSARRYFRKHHGLAAWLLLLCLRPLSIALSWAALLPKRLGWRGIKV